MDRQKFIAVFRDAEWLKAERIILWATCFGVAWFFFICWDVWIHTSLGLTDSTGEQVARDFINYWAGAKLALAGKARAVYDLKEFLAYERSLTGEKSIWRMYSYPPVTLLLSLPLGLLPFWVALATWTAAGVGLCAYVASRITGARMGWIIAFAAPAAFVDIICGQNGHFSAALLASGLLLIERRPVIAGILLGLLCYKPQLGILLPVALLAGKHWRCFFAAAATVIALAALSTLAFGLDIWHLFIEQMGMQRVMLHNAGLLLTRFPTVFGAGGILGLGLPISYALQAVSSIAAVVMIVKTWRRQGPLPVKAAILVLAAFLATPYGWDYDLVIIAFAALWIAKEAGAKAFMPWEKFLWMMLVCLPLYMVPVSVFAKLPVTPVLLWTGVMMTAKRLKAS